MTITNQNELSVDDLEDDFDLISETLMDCHSQRLKDAELAFEESIHVPLPDKTPDEKVQAKGSFPMVKISNYGWWRHS